MKVKISFLFLSLFIGMTVYSQSKTYEIRPVFEKVNQEYITEFIDFNPSFEDISFVGISAYHFDEDYKEIQYRVLHAGQWSAWQTFAPQHELMAKVRTAYEGQFIMSSFSGLQFKTKDILETPLNIRLFMGAKQKEWKPTPQKSMLCDIPDVCDRSCWCSTCPIDATPQLTGLTHIIIHHSAGSNQVNDNYAEVVNFIWDLHVNTNGWDDIGYNWLIDQDGVLYEGRPDGYQGAHFSCINENTLGICLLGDYTFISPTEETINTLVNLVAFEATDHVIDVLSESYHETGEFTLVNVAGHRDSSGSPNACSTTACPGETFYPMLDSIRMKVADLDCYQAVISATQSLDKEAWAVFPNPFHHTISIQHKDLSQGMIEVKNISGHTCAKLSVNQTHDLSHLPKGVYFVLYEGVIIEKVMKQ